jgi:hypothetical protein
MIQSFGDELEKIADFRTNLYEFAGRIGNPLKGLAKGWKMMSPAETLRTGLPGATRLSEEIAGHFSPSPSTIFGKHIPGLGTARTALRRTFAAAPHLQEASTPVTGGGFRQAVEELSRRGWTGEGKMTKYLPLGEKAMVGLGGVATGAETLHALRSPEAGGPGPAERALSGLGTLGTGVMTFGTGGLGLAAPLAAGYLGGRAGRVIDRLRQREQA